MFKHVSIDYIKQAFLIKKSSADVMRIIEERNEVRKVHPNDFDNGEIYTFKKVYG